MPDSAYEISATVAIAAPAEEVTRWLTAPELLERWILGADSVEAEPDGGLRMAAAAGGRAVGIGWSFVGEQLETSPDRLVRRWRIEPEYERTVTYELRPAPGGAVEVACAATTTIEGLAKAAARAGGRAEQKALARSLERLRDGVEGRRRGALARWGDSGKFAGPL